MLSLERKDDDLILSGTYGRPVRLRIGRTAIRVGKGKASYTMSRGRFRFRQRILRKSHLTLASAELTSEGAALLFASEDGAVELKAALLLAGNILRVRFSPQKGCEGLNRLWLELPATPAEHIYGCGEVFTHLDLRGQRVRIWVAEHINIGSILKKLVRQRVAGKDPERMDGFEEYESYYAQPTFVSSRHFFFHSETTGYCKFDFTHPRRHSLELREFSDLVFGFAPDFPRLSEELSEILGRQPPLPDWAYDGAILGIQGGTDTALEKLERAEKAGTKVAALWCQDWEGRRVTAFGKQLMWNWEWDRELYPRLDTLVRELHARGIRFMGYVNPFLALEKDLYRTAHEKGYCVKDRKGEDYLVKITTFPAAMVDLTNPAACRWLKDVIRREMLDLGLDGWMADFGEYLPTDAVLYSGEDPEYVHCTWPARWARLNREVIEEAGRLGEVFFFTRAGHTGSVAASTMMWNGDQHVDWSFDYGLGSVIPGTLSLAMSGFGLTHSDIGGYTTFPPLQRTPELFVRWAEMCAFSPLMRGHEGNRPDDNAQFDCNEETLRLHAFLSRVHAALKPYLKALAAENAEKGIPVMRPVFYHYDEPWAYTESRAYLLGRDLLVAPVLEEGAARRSLRLPEDDWALLWTGEAVPGGEREEAAPLGRPPVYYRRESPYAALFESLKEMK